LAGGQDGKVGQQTLTRTDGTQEVLAGICSIEVDAGDTLCIQTPGGGGYGD
jgi:5-oxoprolinase (ATP-hydrolysing)